LYVAVLYPAVLQCGKTPLPLQKSRTRAKRMRL